MGFLTVHPFDDGNGRIARAVADNAYYDILERSRKGTMDVTPWMDWFLGCLGRAIEGAQTALGAILQKARFWESLAAVPVNNRQRLVLNRLLDGLERKLTTNSHEVLPRHRPPRHIGPG